MVSGAAARRKGLQAEAQARDYLRAAGFRCERIPPGEDHDRGDLLLVEYPGVVSVKHYADVTRAISVGLLELESMMANARTDEGVVIVRRPGKPNPEDWAVVQTFGNWLRSLKR